MSTQPEALRLADELEDFWGGYDGQGEPHEMQAAAELRRLHTLLGIENELGQIRQSKIDELSEQRDELLEALQYAVTEYGRPGGPWNVPSDPGGWLEQARAAIAKATGESA